MYFTCEPNLCLSQTNESRVVYYNKEHCPKYEIRLGWARRVMQLVIIHDYILILGYKQVTIASDCTDYKQVLLHLNALVKYFRTVFNSGGRDLELSHHRMARRGMALH